MKTKLFTLALAALTIGLLGSCEKENPKVPVTGVTLDKTAMEITVGDADVKLTATVAPENAIDKTVSWSSDKTDVAIVDAEGSVHAVAPGTATITVTTTDGGKTATCVVTVKAAVVPVTGVTLEPSTLEITVGDADVKLTATVAPENATDKTVSWSSDKTDVATVDTEGSVHAVAPGTATITVTTTDGGKTATCVVTVKAVLPEGALPGDFTVNSSGKKIHFSQGNLTYNVLTANWAFYEHQYDCATGYDSNLISLFTWGYDATKSIIPDGYTYGNASRTTGNLVQTEDWGCTIGDGNTWRTLSNDEWKYLFNNHSYKWVSVNGVNGYVIAPDGFLGTLSDSYTDDAALAADKLVFLPAAGARYGSTVERIGIGIYWSSSAYFEDYAYLVQFDSSVLHIDYCGPRDYGYSVRLITESK